MARKKTNLIQVGKTADNKMVMSGVFKMSDTYGLPLVDVLFLLEQNNCICSWFHFYEDAKRSGWKEETIKSRLKDAVIDVYDKSFYDIVEEQLKVWSEMTQEQKEKILYSSC